MRAQGSYRPRSIRSLLGRLTRRELAILGLLSAALLWGAAGGISDVTRKGTSPSEAGPRLYLDLRAALPDPDFAPEDAGLGEERRAPARGSGSLTHPSYPGVPETEVYEDRWIFFPRNYYTTININEAGFEELLTLPGIGPSIAGRIILYRRRYVGFSRVKALKRIKGIGDRTLGRLEGKIRLY